ncbi:MAG: T9SS type A sorting domain-containing protein [Bacteroidales bacterium]|nr:T9SS type A sorting domain-containing protein [Bacteroidales bacterium]
MKTDKYVLFITLILAALFIFYPRFVMPSFGEPVPQLEVADEAPVLDRIESDDLIYEKGSGTREITSTITVRDEDSQSLRSATIRFTQGYDATEDVLRFTNQNRITGYWNPFSGVLTLSGRSSVENYQAALRSVRYENTDRQNPSMATRTVSFRVNDGEDNSNTVSRNIVLKSANLAPVLSGIETSTPVYCIRSGQATITSSLNIADPDNDRLVSAEVFITEGYTQNEDFLRFTNQNGITGSWDPEAGKMSLTGESRIENYVTALRSIKYENTDLLNPEAGNRTFSFTVSDGILVSNTVTRNLIVNKRVNAVISGSAIFCNEETISAPIRVDLAGTSPWTFTVTRDNGNDVIYRDIGANPYTFTVRREGTYRIKSISDAHCTGDTVGSGYARIISRPLPTAAISGIYNLCPGETASLQITLTGTAPWKFSYRRNSQNTTEVPNVTLSPHVLSVQQGGTYTLHEVYDEYCKGTVSGSATVTVNPAPDVTLSGLAPAYDKQSLEWVPITGTPSGGTFTGLGVIPYNDLWYFVPSLPPVGTHNIVYAYRESQNSCFGYDTAVVRILEASAVIEFENDRTTFCRNEDAFTVTGVNMIGVTGSFTISGGTGLTDHHNNTATVYPSRLAVGNYTITYSYVDGTSFSVNEHFNISNSPTANFKWDTECYQAGQSVTLSNSSSVSSGSITGYNWKIYKATGFDSYTTRDVTHTFPNAGNHNIEMMIQTSDGCSDTVKKVFALRPVIKLADKTYEESFANNPIEWQSETSSPSAVNSWRLGNPTKGFTGDHCWYTYITGDSPPREQSWVTSPCFDFTNTLRPMLKMSIWRLFNLDRDGATLQYSVDNGKTWQVLGELSDGLNWFNDYQIDGKPGDQSLGWSNYNSQGNDTDWKVARHSLDVLRNRKLVQFRIAYGSDGTARNNNGFAFDNFWIGERNRTVLLEHFTNSSSEDCDSVNAVLNNMANSNDISIIDLQYHTSFPGADPFNQHNPSIPGARVFYYGFSNVPYTILNGGSKSANRFDHEILRLTPVPVMVESLNDADFWISLNSKVSNNILSTEAQVFALKDIPAKQLTVRIAVIEKVITGEKGSNGETSFESVVKAMLPDAAGTAIYEGWKKDEPRYVNQSLELHHVYDGQQLRVVAFVQDESTFEVYQAAIDTIGSIHLADDNLSGSGKEESYRVYPNPVNGMANVEFNRETAEDITLEIYNNLGGLVFVKQIPSGTKRTEIPVDAYPDGLYVFRMVSRDQLIGISKVIISKGF